MSLLTGAAGTALGKGLQSWSSWRTKKAETKVRLAELKAQRQDNSLKDEVTTYLFLGSYFILAFAPPIIDLSGYNGGTFAEDVVAHLNGLLDGAYGYIVGACALAAIGGDKFVKWRKEAKK